MLVMAVFGVNVVQRIRQVTHKDHRHVWQILYERTGLLLDVAILILQISSKYKHLAAAVVFECTPASMRHVHTNTIMPSVHGKMARKRLCFI